MKKIVLATLRFHHLWLLFALLGLPEVGQSSPISIAITGTVRLVDDRDNILSGAVRPGDTITGVYTYDSDTPDSNSLAEVGDYWHTTAPYGISLTVNGMTFRTDPNQVNFLVEIVNDYAPGIPPTDNYLLRSYTNEFAVSAPVGRFGESPMNHISWQLDDPTAAALSSPALPLVPPVLQDWQSNFGLDIWSKGGMGEMFLIRSDVTSAVLVEIDSDGDGVPDDKDQCPDTPTGAIVDEHGCSIDQLVPCPGPRSGGVWENHGKYVSAVTDAAGAFQKANLITEEQKDAIVATAAQSNCGKQ